MSSRIDVPSAEAPAVAPTQARGLGSEASDLMEISHRLVAYNLAYLALAWAVALAAIGLYWARPAWYTFAIAFAVVSSRQHALLNCAHEGVHGKFLPRRRWNDFVSTYLCAAPVGSPFGSAKARHLSHHRLLGTPEDPDTNLHSGEGKRTRSGLVRYFVRAVLGGYAGMVLMGPRAPRAVAGAISARRDLMSLVLVQGAMAAGFALAFAWWVYPALWLAPLVSVTAFCHLIRSFVEHAISESEAPAHGNRLITIESFFIERALLSPYFMNYHAEHHLLPSVPAPRLKELQDRLAGHADTPPVLVRHSYAGALRRYARELPD